MDLFSIDLMYWLRRSQQSRDKIALELATARQFPVAFLLARRQSKQSRDEQMGLFCRIRRLLLQ